MNIFVTIITALAIILVLLRRKIQIGVAMLVGGLYIWLIQSAKVIDLEMALLTMFTQPRMYDIILALYFVMCLEIELRQSGVLTDMVSALRRRFKNVKALLVAMPAFLGLLPSVGGARFSAPIVAELSEPLKLKAEHKAAINFYFRHIFEFSSPIIPGMIMACSIAGVEFGDFLKHLSWVTPLAVLSGWLVMINKINVKTESKIDETAEQIKHEDSGLILSLSSVISIFVLVIAAGLKASMATAIVVLVMIAVLLLTRRFVSIKGVFIGALDLNMVLNIVGIFYFIELLSVTNVLNEIVFAFERSPLPTPAIIACVSFIIGILTGMSQGHVAIVMPIVAALGTGNLDLAGVAMVFGVAGQMLTPTHFCLIVTIDYFKTDIFKTLKPVLYSELLILMIYSIYSYFTWS